MEKRIRLAFAKTAYVVVFVVILPVLLLLWAARTNALIPLPALHHEATGYVLIIVGASLMLAGTATLYRHGKGWPMSPFPPEKFVAVGIYGIIAHPIYTGASLCVVGIALRAGSASGLWLVSPIFILACTAWVWGHERLALKQRFPYIAFAPRLTFPPNTERRPTGWNRISAYLLLFAPWIIADHLVARVVRAEPSGFASWSWDQITPAPSLMDGLRLTIALLVLLAPLLARTQNRLRQFMIAGWSASALGFFLAMMTPPTTLHPSASSLINTLSTSSVLDLEHVFFGVIWTWITLPLYVHRYPRLRHAWYMLAVFFTLSFGATSLRVLPVIAAGLFIAAGAVKHAALWRLIQRAAEALANSWREWDFGYLRIMNHGAYGGLAAGAGILMAGLLIGKEHLPAILIVAVTSMIVSALWAQWIEGSKKLLRPLGFYGGILGVILGAALVHVLWGEDFFLIWAPFAVAAPVIQAIGRMRCLVQGCCHGCPTTPALGIRYFHERSRVVRLAELRGVPLHATPVYSILTNLFSAIFLLKLWFTNMPLPFVIGICFLLNGLSRFVEEAYRGEPQTRSIWGLRLYQWLAVLGMLLGAFLTTIPYTVAHVGLRFNVPTVLIAGAGALLATFVTGIDFPRSNRRFSRLV